MTRKNQTWTPPLAGCCYMGFCGPERTEASHREARLRSDRHLAAAAKLAAKNATRIAAGK